MDISITIVPADTREHAALRAVREQILRIPLGLRFTPEELQEEADDLHIAATCNGEVIGGVLLRAGDARTGRLRQMAVLRSHRARGVGALLVRFLEAQARRREYRRIAIHARIHAIAFYERLDYEVEGQPFLEHTIPHVRMVKQLDP